MSGSNDVATPWVMLVEDDDEFRDGIVAPGLREFGFQVEAVGSAREMYRAMLAREFAFFVLDVGLPDEDGFSLATRLATMTSAPRVLLTGRSSTADRVRGLDGGADAYLTKPVDVEVLAATLRSLGRRVDGVASSNAAPPAAPGEWQVDLDGWRLTSPEGKSMMLSGTEREVVTVLVRHGGEVVGRSVLAAALTDDPASFDPHRLEMLVHRLRRRAVAALGEALPLRAIRGVGYVLAIQAADAP